MKCPKCKQKLETGTDDLFLTDESCEEEDICIDIEIYCPACEYNAFARVHIEGFIDLK